MVISRPHGEKQGFIDNISTKTKPELQELLKNKQKLVQNKQLISKLPNKKAKFQHFHDKIVQKIKSKDLVEQVCKDLSKLDVYESHTKKYVLNDVTWSKKHQSKYFVSKDDDEIDALKILAQKRPL